MTNRDEVVEELMEVVKSGMRRYHSNGLSSEKSASNFGNAESKSTNTKTADGRRRLHLRDPKKKTSSNSYLIPKERSMKLWSKCMEKDTCKRFLAWLSTSILEPFFGYVSVHDDGMMTILIVLGSLFCPCCHLVGQSQYLNDQVTCCSPQRVLH